MQHDDIRSLSASAKAEILRCQTEVSRLRQDVAVTRAIWRVERVRHHEEGDQFLRLLPKADDLNSLNTQGRKRLARSIKKIKLRGQRVDEFEKRLTEEEQALGHAEEQLCAAIDQLSCPALITTPSTTQYRSGSSSFSSDDGFENEHEPEELDQYLELVEEVRLLREEYHSLQVDQLQEVRKRAVAQQKGEHPNTIDLELHERQLQQRRPLVQDLIAKTDQAKQLFQQCYDLGIDAPTLDELILPLDASELPADASAAVPLILDFPASKTDHLQLSLVPMTAIDDRINLWNLEVTERDQHVPAISTGVSTPTTTLEGDLPGIEQLPFEHVWRLEDPQPLSPQGSRSSYAHDIICQPSRPHQRNAISEPNLSTSSIKIHDKTLHTPPKSQ